VCYDISNHRFRVSRNVTFSYNQFMFHYIPPSINDIVILPNFSIMPKSIKRYKPGITYARQHMKQVPTAPTDSDPPPDPEPVEPRLSGRTLEHQI